MSTQQVSESILELASRAEQSLVLANNLLKSSAKRDEIPEARISHWAIFLENVPSSTTVETCAVSIGGTALLMTGEGVDSDIIQDVARLVARLQREDGGWTSFSPSEEEESLTIEAFFALQFLMKVDPKKYEESIKCGIEWLVGLENPNTGGWGFYAGDSSNILATSYSIRVIAEWGRLHGRNVIARDIINRGLTWLVNCQNDDGSWSLVSHQNGSAVQTAIALLALISPGLFRHYSKPVVRGRRWLLEHADNREDVVNNYIVPKRDPEGEITGFHRRISHVNFPQGIILQALLACGTDITDKSLLMQMRTLIDAQAPDGSWKCHSVVYEKPIYAILDACIAMNLFCLQVKNNERTLDIKENVLALNDRVEAIRTDQEKIRQRLEETINALQGISQSLEAIAEGANLQRLTVQKLDDFRQGLFWLEPTSFVGNRVRKYPLIALLLLAFLVYVILRVFYSVQNVWLDIAIPALSALLLGIQLLQHYRSRSNK